MRIEDFLRHSTKRFGDKTALVAGRQRLTFADLDVMSDRMAAALAAEAIAPGDRILVFMANAWETAVSIFAVLKAGAVLVPVDPTASADDLAFVANDSHAAALITQSRLAAVTARAMADAPALRLTVIAGCQGSPGLEGIMRFEDAIAGNGPAPDSQPAVAGADPAMLAYDSAAMGRPTSATATHDELTTAATTIATRLGSAADDVVLCLLPIAFDDGLYQLLTTVKVGATLVLETPAAAPETIFRLVAEENVTVLPLTPAIAAVTREMMQLQPGAFPSLRRVAMANRLPPAVVARLRRILSAEDDGSPSQQSAKALVAAE